MADSSPIITARFWSKVDVGRPDHCWPWRAALDRYGYGQFKGESYVSPKRSHRVAYELVCGDIPPGLVLRHRCNNPACCNPSHLVPGTQGDNHDDREEAGHCPREAGRFAEIIAA
jgi:hypothetical protein